MVGPEMQQLKEIAERARYYQDRFRVEFSGFVEEEKPAITAGLVALVLRAYRDIVVEGKCRKNSQEES